MGSGIGAIHHIDENRDNNNPYNLAPAHRRCHNGWHNKMRKGVARPPEIQAHLRTVNIGRKLTPEHKAAISPRGRFPSEETRRKMSAARTAYWQKRRGQPESLF